MWKRVSFTVEGIGQQYKIYTEIVHLQSLQTDQLDPLSCSLCDFGEYVFLNFMEGSNLYPCFSLHFHCLGFQSQGGSPHLHVSLPVMIGFLRFILLKNQIVHRTKVCLKIL